MRGPAAPVNPTPPTPRVYAPGHLAVGALIARRQRYATFGLWCAALLGSLAPDLIDKSLRLVGVFPWGRTVGHSVFVVAAVALIAVVGRMFEPRARWPAALALGWAGHLVADLVADFELGVLHRGDIWSAWALAPLYNADQLSVTVQPCIGSEAPWAIAEMAVVIAAVAVCPSPRRDPDRAPPV